LFPLKVGEFSSVDSSSAQESDEIPGIVGAKLVPNGMRMSVLPVYVYNCPLGMVTEQLLNRWTCERPGDIYEDLTFEVAIIYLMDGHLFNLCEV